MDELSCVSGQEVIFHEFSRFCCDKKCENLSADNNYVVNDQFYSPHSHKEKYG